MHLLASAFALPQIAGPWLSLALTMFAPHMVAMDSPWWENYERKDRFRCTQQQVLILERNDSQASILMGGQRSTLFRDRQVQNVLHYSGDGVMLSLKGDELQIELIQPMPTILRCQRTEDA